MNKRKFLSATLAGIVSAGLLCSLILTGLADPAYDREVQQEYTFDQWPAGASFGWEGATLKVAHINASGQVVEEGYTGDDLNYVLHANALGEQSGGMSWGAAAYPEAYEVSLDLWFADGVFGSVRIYMENLLGKGKWDSVVFEKGLFSEAPDKTISSAYLIDGDGAMVAASYDAEKGGRFPAIRDGDPESGRLGYGRWMSFKIRRDGGLLSVLLNDVVVFTYTCDTLSVPSTTNINTYIQQGDSGFYVDNIRLSRLSRLTPAPTTTQGSSASTQGPSTTPFVTSGETTASAAPTQSAAEEPTPKLIGYKRTPVETLNFDNWPAGAPFGWEGATLRTAHIDQKGRLAAQGYAGADLNPVLHANLVGTEQAGGTNWKAQSYPDGDFDVSMDLWFGAGTYGFARLYMQNLLGTGQWDSVVFEKGLILEEGNDPSVSSAYVLDGNGQVIAASYDPDMGGLFSVIRDGDVESGSPGFGKWLEFTVRKTGSTLSVLLGGKTVLTYSCKTLSSPTVTNLNTYINQGASGFYIDNITLSKLTPIYSTNGSENTGNVDTGDGFPVTAAALSLLTGTALCIGAAATVRRKTRRQV